MYFKPYGRALNYTAYALIQHICSLHVADFQQICSDYAANFWEKEKLCTKTDNQVERFYFTSNYNKVVKSKI